MTRKLALLRSAPAEAGPFQKPWLHRRLFRDRPWRLFEQEIRAGFARIDRWDENTTREQVITDMTLGCVEIVDHFIIEFGRIMRLPPEQRAKALETGLPA